MRNMILQLYLYFISLLECMVQRARARAYTESYIETKSSIHQIWYRDMWNGLIKLTQRLPYARNRLGWKLGRIRPSCRPSLRISDFSINSSLSNHVDQASPALCPPLLSHVADAHGKALRAPPESKYRSLSLNSENIFGFETNSGASIYGASRLFQG